MNDFPFEILETISESGSQGGVYAARCTGESGLPGLSPGMEVALKFLAPEQDPERQWRALESRAAALSAAPHPGVARYFGALRDGDGRVCVVMERLRGETLRERLARERIGIDAAEALRVGGAVLDALAHAEALGIVHRDIKPSNVFLCEDGAVKVIDFELAHRAASLERSAVPATPSADVETVDPSSESADAMPCGSYDYMAPEFHPSRKPSPDFSGDARSDLFSFGAMFHEMLAGRLPYFDSSTGASGSIRSDGATGAERVPVVSFFARWNPEMSAGGVGAGVAADPIRTHTVRHARGFFAKTLATEREERFSSFAEARGEFARLSVRTLHGASREYSLSTCVGKGGFGAVYRALPSDGGPAVALKYLVRDGADDRFLREARLMAKFADDRLVRFLEVVPGAASRPPVLVMELLPGMPGASLKERLSAQPGGGGLPAPAVLRAFARYAGALALLHEGGVVHRDVKPGNMYLPPDGHGRAPCLMDLGVALSDGTQTAGAIPGTPDYMAPELATSGSRGDARSDLWALGVSMCEALTGALPWPRLPRGAEAYSAWMARWTKPVAPDFSALAPQIRQVVAKLCAIDPAKRFSSAAEAEAAIRALCSAEGVASGGLSGDGGADGDVSGCGGPTGASRDGVEPGRKNGRAPTWVRIASACAAVAIVLLGVVQVASRKSQVKDAESRKSQVASREIPGGAAADTAPDTEPDARQATDDTPETEPDARQATGDMPDTVPDAPMSPLAMSVSRIREAAQALESEIASAVDLGFAEKRIRGLEHSADKAFKEALSMRGVAGSPEYERARKDIRAIFDTLRATVLTRRDELRQNNQK